MATSTEIDTILEMSRQGLSVRTIAARLGRSSSSVHYHLQAGEEERAPAYIFGKDGKAYRRKPRRLALMRGPCVYFIRIKASDHVKIGFTSNLHNRLSTLQTSLPYDLELMRAVRGTQATEIELHQRFASLKVRGEWFRLESPLTEYIEAL